MKDLLIVQPGAKLPTLAPVPGDFADWVAAGMGISGGRFERVHPHLGEPLPNPAPFKAVVVTGSSAMVTDPDAWIADTAAWLRRLVDAGTPVLGICFGHQLLARAFGGQVDDNPKGVEVGTAAIRLAPDAAADPLLSPLPVLTSFQVSHRQSVLRLPPNARLLASSPLDPHHAFSLGARAWGLQFHPEFDQRIIRSYVDYYAPVLEARGVDVNPLRSGIGDTPEAALLLRRFARIAGIGPG